MTDTIPQGWLLEELDLHVQRVTQKNKIGNTNVLTISAQKGLINQLEFFNKSVSSKNLDGYTLIEKGDFAYNKSYSKGYPVGVIRRLTDYNQGVLSPLYICFKVSSDKCSDKYLSYFFDGKYFEHQLSSRIQEGARAHGLINIPIGDFLDTLLLLPPLVEQEKIADILTSVDDTIEHTQTQVAKLRDLKTATMNELLTKGIGHTEFKESEVGLIPTTWSEELLSTLLETLESGSRPKGGATELSGTISSYGGENIAMSDGMCFDSVKKVTQEFAGSMDKGILSNGDVLINKDGANTGKCGFYKQPKGESLATINEHLFLLRGMKSKVKQEYLYYSVCSVDFKEQLRHLITGSAQPGLNSKFVEYLKIPLPPLVEQEKIAEILTSLDDQIEGIESKLVQLEALKKSLMGDLLTGKVRVSVV